MRAVIVGAGIQGLALAWALVRAGHRVTVLEQGRIPNPQSASYDQHRLIHDFNRMPDDHPTITQAFEAWHALSRDIGPLYVETGAVCGFTDTDTATRAVERMRNAGVDGRLLNARAFADALPGLRLDPEHCAVMTGRGGVLLADQIAMLLTRWLAAHDVDLRENTEVISLDLARTGAVVAGGEMISADLLIACTGAWTARLLTSPPGTVSARRQIVTYLEPPRHLQAAWRRSPVFVGLGGADDLWGAPPVAGTDLKLAASCLARIGHPWSAADRALGTEEPQALLDRYRKRLPEIAAYRVLRTTVCFYSSAPDGGMMYRPIGDRKSAWVMAGCDGSDYKLAPALALAFTSRLGR